MTAYRKRLASEKIPKLLLQQSMPATIGLLVMSLYNVVDTIFIGHGVGTLGIAGLAIAFPIQMIVMALAQTVGIGASSIISRALGSKDFLKAERVLGNFFSLSILIGTLLTIIGLIFIKPILIAFGATDTILPYATEYMGVIFWGTLFIFFAMGGNSVIRAEGNAKFAMVVMMMSAGVNIVLDPIFIFTFDMGIRGAAIATVIAQFSAASCALYYFITGRSGVYIHLKNLALKIKTVKEIFAIGASSLGRHVARSIMAIVINNSLGFYGGDVAIAAYGVINRIFMIVMMPMFGLVQGLQPILGYNYGAKNYRRSKDATKLSIKVATFMSTIGFLLLLIFAKWLAKAFSSDTELIELSAYATRILVLLLPFVGFQAISGGYFQAIGKAGSAFFLSILRQVLCLLPFVLILPLFYDLNGIFFAFPAADVIAILITAIMMKREMKRLELKTK